jgi:hypothetical protein
MTYFKWLALLVVLGTSTVPVSVEAKNCRKGCACGSTCIPCSHTCRVGSSYRPSPPPRLPENPTPGLKVIINREPKALLEPALPVCPLTQADLTKCLVPGVDYETYRAKCSATGALARCLYGTYLDECIFPGQGSAPYVCSLPGPLRCTRTMQAGSVADVCQTPKALDRFLLEAP